MRIIVLIFLAVTGFHASDARAQADGAFDPQGFWTGAIVEDASVLLVEIEIDKADDGYEAETSFPDWIFYAPSRSESVRLTANGLVIEGLLSGDAVLEYEPVSDQLVGSLGDSGRTVHLKRSPPPPAPLVRASETSFVSADGTRIAGTLIMPTFGELHSGMVIVRGRGCSARDNGRARFFAQYGIAVLTYDKRGAGRSEGDCEIFTFDDLTNDAIAALNHLATQPMVDPERVGLFGESAGSWVIQAATERQRQNAEAISPAFLATWYGPATSIIQQQVSSAATYGEAAGLTPGQQETLAEVSRIIADDRLSDEEIFARLDPIRRSAEEGGWLDTGFGPDDIPATLADVPKLWLRRFAYDPSPMLRELGDLPYLAVFGAKDPIVPLDENVEALLGKGSDVTVVVLPESGHDYGIQANTVTLPSGREFTVFEGTDTGWTRATIAFLRSRGFMSR